MPRIARVSLTAAFAFAALLAGSPASAFAAVAKPTASFKFTPTKPVVGAQLVLDGRASKCSAKPCRFLWTSRSGRSKPVQLGRASKSMLTLKRAETLAVTLKVTDSKRRSASKTRTIVVAAAPLPAPPFQQALPASPLITAPAPAPVETPTPEPAATPPPDVVAPETAIDSGPTGVTSDATPTFSFSSEPGAKFECAVDGGAFSGCASPLELPNLADGAHTLAVRARDAAGNPDASPATRAFTVDTVAPDTTIDGPTGPTGDATPTFTFASEDGASFECAVDGGAFATCATPLTLDLTDGAHTVAVRARDAAGNIDGTPATSAFSVDTVAPAVAILTSPAGELSGTSATFTFKADDDGATFACRLDDGQDSPCSSPWTLTGLVDGEHTFAVRATDQAGNVGVAQTRMVTVKTPPAGSVVAVATEGDDAANCSPTKPCRTLARAYAAAIEETSVLEIAPGGYADQLLPEGGKKLTIRPSEAQTRPSVRYLTARASDVTIEGLKIEKLTIFGSRQVYDDVDVDGRFARHPGIEHLGGDDNLFKNGRVGNITDEKGALIGPNRFTFENVVFHDVLVTDPSVHNECLYATGAEGLTIRRSTFHACATMDLFVTNFVNGPDFGNITLENNVFEHTTMEAPDSWHFYSVVVHPVVGALRNWVVRYNTFELGVSDTLPGSGRWVGNLGDWDCVPGMTYRFNVGQPCSELDSGVFPAASTKTRPAAFGWVNPAAFNFRLASSSPAIDNGDATDFPSTDRDGRTRPTGWGPDAGAHESE